MSKDFTTFVNNWRPLFYLLLSSREFRILILDSIRIAKRVVYSYTDDIKGDTRKKFLEGEKTKTIAGSIKTQVKEKGAPKLSDGEWDTIQEDLQRILMILAREPKYQQGVEKIFSLLDMFQNSLLKEEGKLPQLNDSHFKRVVGETEAIVSSFSGRETMEEFKYYLKRLIQKSREDEELHTYLQQLKQFILLTKSEEEVRTEEFRIKSKRMARRGRKLMRRFKEDDALKPFLKASQRLITNIKNDEFLQLLRHRAGIVKSDLSYVDNDGKLQIDTDMLSNLQKVLLPVLADALKYIPIPKISSVDPYQEFSLDKIVLCGYDIIPENIRFHLETSSEFSFSEVEVKGTHTILVIQLNQMLTELKDVEFYFKKKSFPEFEDHGRVAFRIKGQGASLTLTYNVLQNPGDRVPRIMEGHADFNISEMDIDFDKDSLKHDLLIPMLTKIFKVQIKKKIEDQAEKNLRGFISKLGSLMTNAIAQMNRPLISGLDMARKNIKSTDFAQICQKRREKLE